MKLILKKSQPTGLLGGVKFELSAQVELAPEEAELVKRYHAGKQILAEKKVEIPFTKRVLVINLDIGSLTAGQKFKCADIAEIIATENEVKEGCRTFKLYLETMNEFGGEEIIEF